MSSHLNLWNNNYGMENANWLTTTIIERKDKTRWFDISQININYNSKTLQMGYQRGLNKFLYRTYLPIFIPLWLKKLIIYLFQSKQISALQRLRGRHRCCLTWLYQACLLQPWWFLVFLMHHSLYASLSCWWEAQELSGKQTDNIRKREKI